MHLAHTLLIPLLVGLVSVVQGEKTAKEAAVLARKLVQSTGIGTLITTQASTQGQFQGYPFGSMDYYSDDCPSTGNPIFVLSDIQTNTKNLMEDPRASLSIQDIHTTQGTPMSRMRMTLTGKLKRMNPSSKANAHGWVPDENGDSGFHDFHWWRLEVEGVYWIGGFGGLHYIGPLNITEYFDSTPKPSLHTKERQIMFPQPW
ncbi:MAG: pyridoxamine 5'-phosphate oxidase-domain-containing protein [Piptocephalis tieghemiana]|nr:MAG: pyridoxamine 5'-phosphate oxidase-domain-containing protein [Piptocephalis tieghemiana]